MDTKKIHDALAKTLDSCSTVKMLAADSKPDNDSTDEKALTKQWEHGYSNTHSVCNMLEFKYTLKNN